MTVMVQIAKGLRVGVLAMSVLALGACTSLIGSNIAVSQTGDNPAPTVAPEGADPDDVVIGRREHPRIIAAYGGVYSDRPAEIMVARIVSRLLAAALMPSGPDKRDRLANLDLELERLRYLLRLAKDVRCLSPRAWHYAAGLLLEIGRSLGGWRKSLSR